MKEFHKLLKRGQSVPAGAKANDLILEPCTYKAKRDGKAVTAHEAEFGVLIVPENRSKPGSRLIALPVLRIRATGRATGAPIFYFEGGPGSSNMRFVPPQWLLAGHDFVQVGYRAADGSVILSCPEITKAMKGKGRDLLSAESLADVSDAVGRSAERLQKEGVDLSAYTMADVIEDMEAARVALGYERIHLLSESYGTRVAILYSWLHPKSIHRSALVAVNPPGHFMWKPEVIDGLLEHYAELWAKDPSCVRRVPDLMAAMREVFHRPPSRWLFLPIDPGKVRVGAFSLLFHRGSSAMLFDAISAAAKGDSSGLAMISLMIGLILPRMVNWGDMICKGGSGGDFSPPPSISELDPPGSVLGSPMSMLHTAFTTPGRWPITLVPEELRRVQPSDVETLLLGGSVDFSTPPEGATRELVPHLSRGRQIVLSECGHCDDMWKVHGEATRRLLLSFYDTGTADDSLVRYIPMDFHVRLGLPTIAKLALGVPAALVVLAVVLAIVL